MANKIIVTRAATISTGLWPQQAFTIGQEIQPDSPYYLPMLWAGHANDTGIPGSISDPIQMYETVVLQRPTTTGQVPTWDQTNGKWVAGAGGAGSPSGLPSYAQGLGLVNSFDPASGFYNWKASNMKQVHTGLIRALNGGTFHGLTISASDGTGWNGAAPRESGSPSRVAAGTIAGRMGLKLGTGLHMPVHATSMLDQNWTTTGSVLSNLYAMLTMNAGSSATYTSPIKSTVVEFYYSHLSSAFTYQLDGAAAVAVTPNGSTGWGKVSLTGQSNIKHVLKFNAATSFVFISGVEMHSGSGVRWHNISYGGARATVGSSNLNGWTNATAGGLLTNRKGTFDAMGITPDVVMCGLGANDKFQGDADAAIIAGLTTIRNWYPTAAFVLFTTGAVAENAAYDTFCGKKYQLADTLDAALLDSRVKIGTSANALADGLLGPDGHAIEPVNSEMGRILGDKICQMAGGSTLPIPAEYA